MNALQIIEAEDPKATFRAMRGYVTPEGLKRALEPLGFWPAVIDGHEVMAKDRGPFYYAVIANGKGGAAIWHYRNFNDGKGLVFQETTSASSMSYLLRHLRLFSLAEAENPKHFLQRVAGALRYEHPHHRVTRILTSDDSYIHYEEALSGSPVVKTLVYSEKVPEESRASVGLRLLNAAYDYARSQNEYRIRVSVGTTHFERGEWTWDVDRNEDCELGNLVNAAKEGVTGASGMVRYITLESEDPKAVFRHATQQALHWDFARLRKHLEPYGFKAQEMGCRCLEKEMGGKLYSIGVSSSPDKAYIVVYKRGTGGRWRDYTSFTAQYTDLLRPEFLQRIMRGDFDVNLGENVMALDAHGGLKVDDRPKAPHSIWTHQRKDQEGQPEPYHRIRTLPNGLSLEMFIAFRKDQAPTQLLSLVKQYGPEVAEIAARAATDLAYALEDKGVTVVMPMPSAKPLARRLARLIANRMNVRFEDRISKTGQVRHLPISKRKALAPKLYSVSGRFKNEVVCLVDDYIVTSASMMAAAIHAYSAGARKVVGAALAI